VFSGEFGTFFPPLWFLQVVALASLFYLHIPPTPFVSLMAVFKVSTNSGPFPTLLPYAKQDFPALFLNPFVFKNLSMFESIPVVSTLNL